MDDPRQLARAHVQRAPGDPIAWVMLAEAELDAGDAVAGERAAVHALALHPDHPEALARLGRSQSMRGRKDDAVASLTRAAAVAPRHPGILVWLGHALEDVRRVEEAADAFARANTLLPSEPHIAAYLLAARRRLCDWRDIDALSLQVREAVRTSSASVEPFAFLSEDASPAEQLACARQRASVVARLVRPMPPTTVRREGPLRLGFLSNGFGSHPTGLLTVAMFEALRFHDDVQAHLFALTPDDGGAIRRRLHEATIVHGVGGVSHAAVAQRIRSTGIDVLFDLRGWGGGGTPEVLAMRPAPLQVNWLAYPGTSGAPWIDYVLGDRVVLPETLWPHFSECVAWLPACFQPSDTMREVPPAPTRRACGLPETGVVFCCFNNSYKLNPRSMRRAFRILERTADSVLWLLSGPGMSDDRLRASAQAHGIDPARLVFMAKQPHAAYLAHLRLADLFLDTEPYNAHTTASDALWAGCPVLTRPGDTFASRVAASLLQHMELDDLIVDTDEAFVERACNLAATPDALAALRCRVALARVHAPLFDIQGFAAGFVSTVQRMADRAGRGLPPAPLV